MRRLINAEVMQHTMRLKQLGGTVEVINSKMCYVKFDVSGFKVSYSYNVNSKGQYYLERIKPYPLALRVFDREEDVIEIIEIDLEQFKSAIKSHNVNAFIDISRTLHDTLRRFEDLFLYYNVPHEEVEIIIKKLQEIDDEIIKTKDTADRLYFRKEPENL